MARMAFSVLGPMRAWRDQVEFDLGYPKQRAVLAALVLAEGTHVTPHQLVDAVWGDDPPRTALATIRSYVYRLRRTFGADDVIRPIGGGYALSVAPGNVDLGVFKALLSQARSARGNGDHASAVELFDNGLALWKGTPLAGVPGPFAETQRGLLEDLRLAAVQERLAGCLDLGRYAEAAAELSVLTTEYPLAERLREMSMIALYGAGRQAEALAVFDATRRVLREELGVDPAPRLQEIHRRILAADPALEQPASAADAPITAPMVPPVRPAQLPADVPDFVARDDELRLLGELAGARSMPSSPVVVISGMAGVGKTTLAVHAAHRAAAGFPGGQLYVNLQGFDPGGASLRPVEALGSMLHAFGVPAGALPSGLPERAGLYRSLLADRRVLVVLDNASDASQVRPLLPGGAGCLTIITGRRQLPGLTATHGAHSVNVQPFGLRQAREFLQRRLNRRTEDPRPAVLDEIVELCGRLPLALAIVAAHAENTALPPAAIIKELRATRGSLDAFAGDDPVTDVRAVFSWSYQALQPQAARLFRLLSLHPGPDVAVPAAAALIASPVRRVREPLAELTRAHLLVEHASARYSQHDLLRVYATELTETQDSTAGREQALRRLMDHYTHSASAASRLYSPTRDPIEPPLPESGVSVAELATAADAATWFGEEYLPMLELVTRIAAGEFDAHAWHLAWAMIDFLDQRGLWHELARANRTAMAAATRLGDPVCLTRTGPELVHADRRAAQLFAGTAPARANRHSEFGWAREMQGPYDRALRHAHDALQRHRAAGDRAMEAVALNTVGWYHAMLGRQHQAVVHCRQALSLLEKLDDRYGQADTWASLGFARHHLGQYGEAAHSYQQALRLYREVGARYAEAETLVRLGHAHRAAGDIAATGAAWTDALAILDALGHDGAEAIRGKLREFRQVADHLGPRLAAGRSG